MAFCPQCENAKGTKTNRAVNSTVYSVRVLDEHKVIKLASGQFGDIAIHRKLLEAA